LGGLPDTVEGVDAREGGRNCDGENLGDRTMETLVAFARIGHLL